MNENEGVVISIDRILYVLSKKWLILIFCAVFGAVASFGVSKFILKEVYTTSATLYIGSNAVQGSTAASNVNAMLFNRELINTYTVVLKSDSVMTKVSNNIKKYGLQYSSKQLMSMMEAAPIEETEILKISVACANPVDAAIIANAIAEEAPDELARITNASFVEVIDPAKTPTRPSSPNVKGNVILGILIALLLSAAIFVLIDIMDTSIRDAEALENAFKQPVLGTIPVWEESESDEKA